MMSDSEIIDKISGIEENIEGELDKIRSLASKLKNEDVQQYVYDAVADIESAIHELDDNIEGTGI